MNWKTLKLAVDQTTGMDYKEVQIMQKIFENKKL